MNKKKTITFWSDFACPYCYIGETRLQKAMAELGVRNKIQLEMKAYQLEPEAHYTPNSGVYERYVNQYGLAKEDVKIWVDKITRLGTEEGLDFHYENAPYTNTLDAHRLTKLAREKGGESLAMTVIERLFRAYYKENLILEDPIVIIQCGIESGLCRDDVRDLLKSDKYKKEVLADEKEAEAIPVEVVPHFVIGEQIISGIESVEDFKKAIQVLLS